MSLTSHLNKLRNTSIPQKLYSIDLLSKLTMELIVLATLCKIKIVLFPIKGRRHIHALYHIHAFKSQS